MVGSGWGFPFPWALLPVCATMCFIAAGTAPQLGYFNRFIGLPPFVYIGKLSYAIYLWHWPAIVLTKWSPVPFDQGAVALIVLWSMLVSMASYHLLEGAVKLWRPKQRRKVYAAALAGCIFVNAVLFVLFLSRHALFVGSPGRAGYPCDIPLMQTPEAGAPPPVQAVELRSGALQCSCQRVSATDNALHVPPSATAGVVMPCFMEEADPAFASPAAGCGLSSLTSRCPSLLINSPPHSHPIPSHPRSLLTPLASFLPSLPP